ncbi:MAG: polymer-forming cytoskeletal protein, partial [Chloroflexota bacterium]|nr:polymer-forming cytoskeletal protein [Chloroflexota bacterium]
MKKTNRQRLIWLVLLLAAGLLFPVTPALADSSPPGDDGIVIWNEDYTLEEGEWVDGDLVVFNGDVTLEEGSRVEGSVIVWNGSADVEGSIEGDLVVSSGDIYLGDSAQVDGDVVCSWDCDIEQEEEARVDGGVIEGVPMPGLRFGRLRNFPIPVPSLPTFQVSGPGEVLNWALGAIRSVAAILVVAVVAGLVALIWPQPTEYVGRAAVAAPWPSLGMGLLTVVAATVLIIVLAITICFSPVAVLIALALGAAGLFGWICIGTLVGERLLEAFNVQENRSAPLWAAGLGTLVITLIGTGLSAAFCLAPLGWLMFLILSCIGLGAVVLTRFGTTAYVPTTGAGYRSSRPAPVSPATPPAPTPVEASEPLESPEPEKEEETGA